ncbi:hypothetical protein BE221DRAFT_200730 [Ostreococcus tauri]|uniref:Uncharacterized protein n=1 Tax=Ostreococcus tauri TaxID=70448 RepID=A0A1Y5I5L4_OSTTA|nr:hypothetical protein BE221DRAFT_200730 [Ostreococcus tauri]
MCSFLTTFDAKPSGAEWIGLVALLDALIENNAEVFRGRLSVRKASGAVPAWTEVDVGSPALRVEPLKAGGGIDVFSIACGPTLTLGSTVDRFDLFRDEGVLHTTKVADEAFCQLLVAWIICIQQKGYALSVELLRYSGNVQQVMEWVGEIFPDATAPHWLMVCDQSIHRPDLIDFRA